MDIANLIALRCSVRAASPIAHVGGTTQIRITMKNSKRCTASTVAPGAIPNGRSVATTLRSGQSISPIARTKEANVLTDSAISTSSQRRAAWAEGFIWWKVYGAGYSMTSDS
jgi:hypothetical protein